MNLGEVLFGLASVWLGSASVARGLTSVAKGVKTGRGRAVSLVNTANTQHGQMRVELHQVRTLDDRLRRIKRNVRRGRVDPRVITWTRAALTKKCGKNWCVPEKDTMAEVRALYDAMRSDVRYTSDIFGIDTYANPKHTLATKAGDCDDFSSLACASLHAVGIPCKLRVIRTKGAKDWDHIYAMAGIPKRNPKQWIAFDASVPKHLGWEAPASMVAARRDFPID
jgi:predicted transglutaminase-like cysteine proteinase